MFAQAKLQLCSKIPGSSCSVYQDIRILQLGCFVVDICYSYRKKQGEVQEAVKREATSK